MQLHYAMLGVIWWCASLVSGMAAPEGKPFSEDGKVTLSIPRSLGAEDALSVRVTVGTLPKGARIVVRSETGEVIGSIVPFGQSTNRQGVFYTLPVPSEMVADRKVSLGFILEEAGGTKSRVPTEAEIKEVKPQLGTER